MKKIFFTLLFGLFLVLPANATVTTIIDNLQSGTNYGNTGNNTFDQSFVMPTGINNIVKVDYSSYNCVAGLNVTFKISTSRGGTSLGTCTYTTTSSCNLTCTYSSPILNLTPGNTYWLRYEPNTGTTKNGSILTTNNITGTAWRNSTEYASGDWSFKLYYDTQYTVVCGDGVKSAGEACDDGNLLNGDGCSSTCTLQPCSCGNSITQNYVNSYGSCYETCDDGNAVSGDGCNKYCTSETGLIGGLASGSSTYMMYMAQATSGMSDGFSKLLQFYLGVFLLFVIISMVFTIVIRVMWSMKKRSKPFVFNTEKTVHQNNNIKNYYPDNTEISIRERNLFGQIKALRKKNKYD